MLLVRCTSGEGSSESRLSRWRSRAWVHTPLPHASSTLDLRSTSSVVPPLLESPRHMSAHFADGACAHDRAQACASVALCSMISSTSVTSSKFSVSAEPELPSRWQLSHLPQRHCSSARMCSSCQCAIRKRQRQTLTFSA